MKCTDCKYCVEQDCGYSNYTVEGTEVDCLLGLNPAMPVGRFYGEEPSLSFAERCEKFISGSCVYIDVDRECIQCGQKLSAGYTDDPEIGPLLDMWDN